MSIQWGPPKDETDRIAQLLIATWERVEGPVTASYVASFADLARAVVADRATLTPPEHDELHLAAQAAAKVRYGQLAADYRLDRDQNFCATCGAIGARLVQSAVLGALLDLDDPSIDKPAIAAELASLAGLPMPAHRVPRLGGGHPPGDA